MIEFLKLKRHYIMAIAILFVVVSLSGTTYSLFLKADTTNTFTYSTGMLDLQFVEDEKIVLQSAFPMNDGEGIASEPYELTLKNTGTLPYVFNLKMLSATDENVIDTKYIKVKVNNNLPHTLYTTNNLIAQNLIIYPNEEITFKINIWLDISTPNKELGKTFTARIVAEGNSIYKTLDSSGANKPVLEDNFIPVYYDTVSNAWKKADSSNTIQAYEWYNYDNQKWANIVTIKENAKTIYDLTGKHDIKIDELITNNGNIVIKEQPLDIPLSKINYRKFSNILRIKFDNLKEENLYIISNGNMSYYYDNQEKKFIFQIGEKKVSSEVFEITKNTWYIIGFTYDSNQVKFYVNGENIKTSSINGSIYSENKFKLGSDNTFEETSKITVGDLYIYNDILTEAEINTNYKVNINIIYNNLVLGYNEFYPMTKKEYYISSDIGTTIDKEDIETQYVWIPRFKYKLWNVTGDKFIDSYDAYHKGIDIVFENGTNTSGTIYCQNNECYSDLLQITKVTQYDNGKYYTHPAFKNLDKEVTGLWVSKYEISTSSNTCNDDTQSGCLTSDLPIEIKSGATAWRNNYLSNFYQVIKKLNTDNSNYHMIKNTEWGAIAYLSHSKYGLCQNNTCKEIGINNTYIEGNVASDSTTNNNYGVFDLAGSAAEFVMANYTNNQSELNLANSHFMNIPINSGDYDLYYENTFILGDATKEISLENGIWYDNHATYVDSTNNWFIRGGIANQTDSGIFYYSATTDQSSNYITTRIVLK